MRTVKACLTVVTLLIAPVAMTWPVHAEDDIAKQIINSPNTGSWSVMGDPTSKSVRDADVQGGKAVVVNVSGSGNPWEVSANNVILKKVTKGDKLASAVWLKANSADGQPVRVHALVQLLDAPWTPINETDFTVTDTWKLYTFETTAPKDYDAKKIGFNVHLKTGKQTVFLGPAFVLNMGPAE